MLQSRLQNFCDETGSGASAQHIAALRDELKRRGLDGYLVPHADRHQSEYLPPSEERLAFISGFTGSAGTAIVLLERAVMFVDGRYSLVVRDQVDPTLFEIVNVAETSPEDWLRAHLAAHARIGFDPFLHTISAIEALVKACEEVGGTLVASEPNAIDAVWPDRPAAPLGPVNVHPIRFAGETSESKLARIVSEIRKLRADALVVSDPQSIAWTFNIRGSDVAHIPVALGYAIITLEGRPNLFIDERKLTREARAYLEPICEVCEPDDFVPALKRLGATNKIVRLDQTSAADAIRDLLMASGAKPIKGRDPIALMKAVKNECEIDGARAAHLRDGVAVTGFLSWFDREAPKGALTEIDAVGALETFRRETGLLKDIAFPTISGAGPNGAIVHYRVTEKTNRTIKQGELFLIDSGAQYQDGTTDITRTIAIGQPSAEMRERFTRVLKGHIAIAQAIFPEGITGAQLDPLARQALWQAGLDYDHGTGHGVGSYLSVHEGPASISKRGTETALKAGMILSNEPGYYKAGAYGIRIENLVLVVAAPAVSDAEKPLLGFETLTLAPIDQRLIDPKLLDDDERAWIDAYHARVAKTLSPHLDAADRQWLEAATRAL